MEKRRGQNPQEIPLASLCCLELAVGPAEAPFLHQSSTHPKMDTTLTASNGAPIGDNENSLTVGAHGGPILLQDFTVIDKLAHFDREVIPERRVHARVRASLPSAIFLHLIASFTVHLSDLEALCDSWNFSSSF